MATESKIYVGAIDQGTTSTRFILFNKLGHLIASHQVPLLNTFPKTGWQEQNPEDIYNSVVECLQGVADQGYSTEQLKSIGITNQRETTIVWNRITGKPYYNSIVWCDTRTEILAQELINSTSLGQDLFRKETGLPISTYFSALKIQWLIQNIPDFSKDLNETPENVCIGTVDSWLLYKLTGEFKTDISNASRTLLFNLHTLTWDKKICESFGLKTPEINLPPISHNCDYFGTLRSDLPFGTLQITGVLGDQQSSLLGFGCLNFGEVKTTYGTGAFLLMNTGPNLIPSHHGLLTTIGFQLGEKNSLLKKYQTTFSPKTQKKRQKTEDPYGDVCYALEGSVASCGSLLTWLIESMKIANSPSEICHFAFDVESNADVLIVPAFAGLLAPYWCLDARGIILGLTRYCTNKHLCRAVLESICMQTRDVVEAMKHDVIEGRKSLAPIVAHNLQLDQPPISLDSTIIQGNDDAKNDEQTLINKNETSISTILPLTTSVELLPENAVITEPIDLNDECYDQYAYDNIIKSLRVDGGVANSNYLCSVQSDVLNITVLRAIMQERTALGAAIASGLGSGFFTDVAEVHTNIWSGSCDVSTTGNEYNNMDCPDIYKPNGQGDGFFQYKPNVEKRHENLPKFIRKWAVAIEKSKGWASIE